MYDFFVAGKKYEVGESIFSLGNIPCRISDPKRLQINEFKYILPPYVICHSCSPNSYIDWKTNTLKALISIAQGEKVTYSYGTSEDDYSIGKFTCTCGSKSCIGIFKGFKYMSEKERLKIKKYISPYLKRKYYP